MPPAPRARLLLPRPSLAGCVFSGIERDTRGTALADSQRFNYYPAAPMAVLSWTFEGTLHMVEDRSADGTPVLGPPLPPLVLSGPQRRPRVSWSPGPVHALMVGFYPEALARLAGVVMGPLLDRILPLEEVVAGPLADACRAVLAAGGEPFAALERELAPLWSGPGRRGAGMVPLMGDWVRALAGRAALSPAGRGLRQAQRRVRAWAGQSHRDLQLYARVEDAMVRAGGRLGEGTLDLAALAMDAGFADQSHMGREVRRVTGLPPGRLDELMATDEAFWFYRLVGEALAAPAGTAEARRGVG